MIGLVFGASLIVGSVFVSGHADLFWNIPSAFIIFGGTIGATIMAFPPQRLKTIGTVIKKAFSKAQFDLRTDIATLVRCAEISRKDGLLALENNLDDLTDAAEPVLQKISEILVTYQDSFRMVRIEGHTDNRPINTHIYDSNWELSTSRAVNVLRWLLETSGIEAKKFSAIGYSEYYPVDDNSTNEGKRKNRRVDFFIEGTNE
ncbi:OmpA family protein [Lacrimispora sp.]|jgi:outer membrane protein OmpA-like peptidoglycan-associated protein|uniref:OmpA family protein n=1 Tax=Lacrimispora sp. TaxID=2719234 RepID=UPI002898CEC7|nr:OmpA family protein [Lacrimispora sp.]